MTSNSRPRRRHWSAVAAVIAIMWLTPIQAAAAPSAGVPRSGDMIVPLSQVQSIVRAPTLEVEPYDERTSPWVDHSMDPKLTPACRHFVNEDEAFGSTWLNFTAASYRGESNLGVRQSIAVYPDAGTARRTLEALKTAARQCRTHASPDLFSAGYTLTEPDSATLLVQYPETVSGPGSVCMYALRNQVLVEVGAPHFSTDPRVARTVLALITKKIPT